MKIILHISIFLYLIIKMKKVIIINNLLISIDFLPNESDEMIYDRINYIIQKFKENKDFNRTISLSKIYSNIKYKNSELCIYK